ncbi:MAG: ATP phosphoribosyltransferase [Limnochordia bacterium]|jgi:ATP phosphoribosyltransferase
MLKLVLPTGSLEKPTLEVFEAADLPVVCLNSRSYRGEIDDPRISSVRFMRPQEIPAYVAEGVFDMGICGLDWIMEQGCLDRVVRLAPLCYSRSTNRNVKIVVAVHKDSGISDPRQIPPGSKVTTEYVALTERYFRKLGIPVRVEFSYGTTEAKVPDMADVAVELTERGTTLRANNLKVIDVVAESETTLIANSQCLQDPDKRSAVEAIKTLLLGAVEARGKVLLKLNVAKKDLSAVLELMPALKAPTVGQLYGSEGEFFAVESVVEKQGINVLIPQLVEAGAEDILVLPITKIIR